MDALVPARWPDRAVLVSSYLMSELGDVADHLVVVSRGRVTANTSVREHCDCG
jgi:ABC-type Na+ transport system ATPase subunit NatA